MILLISNNNAWFTQKATGIAERMVKHYGMSDRVGLRTRAKCTDGKEGELINEEINRLLNVSI